jgi:hypothetical protein
MFCQRFDNWQIGGKSSRIVRIIWIDKWLAECMRYCTTSRLVQILSDISMRFLKLLQSLACKVVVQDRQRPIDPRLLVCSTFVQGIYDFEEAQKLKRFAVQVHGFAI